MSAFGDALTRLMTERHTAVRELAARSAYSAGHISNLRTGSKRPSPECAAELDELLGGGGELTALADHKDPPGATTYPPAQLAASPLPFDDVNPVEHLAEFRRIISDSDNLFGPRRLVPVVREQLTLIQQIRHGRSGADARDLLCMQARYAETLAWLYQDSAQFRDAQYWLDRSLEWAHMADDRRWAAFTLARKSQLAGDMHDPASAVDLADAAARMAGNGTRLRAAGAAYQAHGHALNGDASASLRALDTAREIAARPEEDPTDPWAPWLDVGYVDVQGARCVDALGDHTHAADLFRAAISGIPPQFRRDRGVYTARLALASAGAGDIGQAIAAGRQAASIARLTGSGRIFTELRRLNAALRPVPAAARFREQLSAVISEDARPRR